MTSNDAPYVLTGGIDEIMGLLLSGPAVSRCPPDIGIWLDSILLLTNKKPHPQGWGFLLMEPNHCRFYCCIRIIQMIYRWAAIWKKG